jgi:hypothetical protein
MPEICKETLSNTKLDFDLHEQQGIKGGVIFVIVVGLILLNIVLVYCYRRYTRREIQTQMNTQIESAVSQYFALTQGDPTQKPYVK